MLVSDTISQPPQPLIIGSYGPASESSYCTLIGGSSEEWATRVTFDNEGNTILVGRTDSLDFPVTPDAFQTEYGGGIWDVFVSKFSPSGSLLYSSFIGGDNYDVAFGVNVDSENNIVIVGSTESEDFPVTPSALQSSLGGYRDAFIAKVAPNGTLLYSTYLGGTGEDIINGVEFDDLGNYLLGGRTYSPGFGTPGVYQENNLGTDAFVARISANGSILEMFSYIGGSNVDYCHSMIVDSSFNFVIAGDTESYDYPTTDGAIVNSDHGYGDAFLTKISYNGSSLLYSTKVAGSDSELLAAVDVDSEDNMIIVGYTASDNLAVSNAFQSEFGGGAYDIFIAKFSSIGDLSFLTYFGTNSSESAFDVTLDSDGNIIFVGTTYFVDSIDATVTKMSSDGQVVLASSILGGYRTDSGDSIAIDNDDDIVVSGHTHSIDFPVTTGAYQTENAGESDCFVCHSVFETPGSSTNTTPGYTDGTEPDFTIFIIGGFTLAVLIAIVVFALKKRR